MDKRSIFGFVLILLILLLWPQWSKMINPPSEQPPEQQEQSAVRDSQTQGLSDTVKPDEFVKQETSEIVEAVSLREEESLESSEPERIIRVETEDFIVLLSSYGGVVKSIQLKKYFTENGYNGDLMVEMISPPETSPWQATGALTLGNEENLSYLNNVSFKVIGQDISIIGDDEPQTLSFIYSGSDGGTISKNYTFFPRGYDYKLRLSMNNISSLGFSDKFTLGWLTPVLPTETDFKEDLGKFSGYYYKGGEVVENKDVDVEEPPSGNCKWVAVKSKYFTNIIVADDIPGSDALLVGHRTSITDSEGKAYEWKKFGVGLTFDISNGSFANDLTIYSGPIDYYRLQKMGHNLSQIVDMGWKFFRPFAIGILWIFTNLYKIFSNYGLVIIIFSILMKVIFWPLTRKSSTSMMKMKDLQPKMQELKEKFKNDPKKIQTETMKLYKEYGVNPFGSCLPLLVQLPIFWAMFSVLKNSIEIRAAGFIFWITDLSQKDPYYILAILMASAMFLQQKMTISDPKQKMMIYIMPAVFLFIFGGMPSGLVLYWTMFSIIGIFEQLLVKRKIAEEKRLAS